MARHVEAPRQGTYARLGMARCLDKARQSKEPSKTPKQRKEPRQGKARQFKAPRQGKAKYLGKTRQGT
jgi:hypothetical protein